MTMKRNQGLLSGGVLTNIMTKSLKKHILRTFIAITFSAYVQSQTVYKECCEVNLMDATSQVLIQTNLDLSLGQMQAMSVRLCTTDQVYVQIWSKTNDTTYKFKWQIQITPTVDNTNKKYIIVDLTNNPVILEPLDRLGIYSSASSSSKIPIPYESTGKSVESLSIISQRFTDSNQFDGVQLTAGGSTVNKFFGSNIIFCQTAAGCRTTETLVLAETPVVNPLVTITSSSPGQCCEVTPLPSCDPSGSITNTLNNQNKQITALQYEIDTLLKLLNSLLDTNLVTGLCPPGFTFGVYGTGKCYLVQRLPLQLAQAAIHCQDLYGATLVQITSALEDSFVRSLVLNSTTSTSTELFFTAGLYYIPLRNWFWYNDQLIAQFPFTYRNWLNGMEPAPFGITDVCSVFTVNVPQNIDYWQKATCTDSNYFICQTPKICL